MIYYTHQSENHPAWNPPHDPASSLLLSAQTLFRFTPGDFFPFLRQSWTEEGAGGWLVGCIHTRKRPAAPTKRYQWPNSGTLRCKAAQKTTTTWIKLSSGKRTRVSCKWRLFICFQTQPNQYPYVLLAVRVSFRAPAGKTFSSSSFLSLVRKSIHLHLHALPRGCCVCLLVPTSFYLMSHFGYEVKLKLKVSAVSSAICGMIDEPQTELKQEQVVISLTPWAASAFTVWEKLKVQ